jgi:predicted LPLAT superfamily acyltransferase
MNHWIAEKERGSTWTIRFIFWLCKSRHQWMVELLLHPIAFYFLLTAGSARQASRNFFQRAVGRFSWLDHYRQLLCFSRSLVDRVLILSGMARDFKVNSVGRELLIEEKERGQGLILLGSHLGNFEAAKVLIKDQANLDVHVVAYFGGSQKIRHVLDQLNPEMTSMIIDPTETDAVFRMRDVIERGGILAILGDRTGIGDKQLPVSFLGEKTHLPAGPYFLASILHCPIYCFFGLRVADREYDSHVIKLADRIQLSRGKREEQAAEYAQKYADLLAVKARQYSYNWFNFFEFWKQQAGEPH